MTFNFSPKKRLTKSEVAARVDDYDLLSYYVPEFKGYNSKIKSNIRTGDKDASLHFIYKGGRAVISDFGTRHVGMNAYNYLLLVMGLPDTKQGFMSLLEIIRKDFKLYDLEPYTASIQTKVRRAFDTPILHNFTAKEKVSWDIRYRSRELNSWPVDSVFWGQFGITKPTLELYNVIAAESYMLINADTQITKICSNENPSYIYLPHKSLNISGWRRKVYSPYESKDNKWFNTLPRTTSLGLAMLPEYGDTLLIETSLKDTMCIYEMFKDEDVWATDLFAESVFLSEQVLASLKRRFKHIVIHGDNDETGIRQAKLFSELYNLPWFVNPKGKENKDTSDMRKNRGLITTKQFICEKLQSTRITE